jgi:L,D-transpeptidase YcbB
MSAMGMNRLRAFLLLAAACGVEACADLGDDYAMAPGNVLFRGGATAHMAPPVRAASYRDQRSTQGSLRDILLADDTKASPQALTFYANRDFQPVWISSPADEKLALDTLARAHEQGLQDKDYRLPESLARRTSGNAGAKYDLALTEAILRYARDVRTGRVRPASIYEDVDIAPPRFDAGEELGFAFKTRALSRFFALLPPPHPQYRQLMQAVTRYRAIAEQGGWPEIPGPASGIKLDGKDKRTALLTMRLAAEDPELASNPNPPTGDLVEAIKRFQARNGLEADGHIGAGTIAALNISATARLETVEANMERWRWLPRTLERRYIAVNVPDQSVDYVRNGEVILNSRVIIGRKANPTPMTRTAITGVIANPPWNIPGFIAARDLLPKLKRNANYLASRNMVLMDGPPGDPTGHTVDWKSIRPETFPYAVRQLPGPKTALGQIMLDSPNDFDVYLHDTPGKKYFQQNDREISNGCVRVQQIFQLASLALTDGDDGMPMLNDMTKTGKTQRIELQTPLPVYFLYWTAMPSKEGGLEFRPDLYGRDATLIAALTGADGGIPTPRAKPNGANLPVEDITP